ARRYDAAGVPTGGEFQVNSFTPGFQNSPAVASDPTGGFVVVWQSNGAAPAARDPDGVFARRFDSTAAPLGAEFQVNSYTTGSQREPAVAIDGDGNFVVVWDSIGYRGGQDGSQGGVFGQHFLRTGEPLGDEFQVNTYTTGDQAEPSISADATGDF